MAKRVDLYHGFYGHFGDQVYRDIRAETYGVDLGQNSWLTDDELDRFLGWLEIGAGEQVLEVASGSGGPAAYVSQTLGCHVTGIDSSENGIRNATETASAAGLKDRVRFQVADANAPLPFAPDVFDTVLCIDAINHFPDRAAVLREWHRVLRPGRRALFTDPVVVTGPVSNDELARRSSIGVFLFVPGGLNEALVEQAGFRLRSREDVTENTALVAERWHAARAKRRDDLVSIEGDERFEELQQFLATVHALARERRLSRIAYLVEKPN